MRIVVAYRGIPHAPGRAFGDTMIRVFTDLGHEAVPYGRWYQTARWMGTDATGDLLLYLECNDADEQYHELRYFDGKRVYWAFDAGMERRNQPNLVRCDAAFNTNRLYGGLYCGAKIEYLPVAFDTTSMAPFRGTRFGAAIIGTAFPERVAFADALGIHVIDPPSVFYPRFVSGLKVHVHAHNSSGPGVLVSRIWETMGLGVALLAPRTPELEELFTDGVHCVMYDGVEDARAKLIALLTDDAVRKTVAKRGRAEILKKHTFRHRALQILEAVA